MAYRARTAESIPQGKLGAGQILTIDGVTFTPRMKRYAGSVDQSNTKLVDSAGEPFGAPTPAMLANDSLIIRTLAEDLPWPGSAEDRHGKGACQNGMANALAGAISPFGEWPSRLERISQSNTRLASSDAKTYTERVLSQRPYKEEEKAVIRAKANARAAGMDDERFEADGLDVASIPDAPGTAREPVGAEASGGGQGGKRR